MSFADHRANVGHAGCRPQQQPSGALLGPAPTAQPLTTPAAAQQHFLTLRCRRMCMRSTALTAQETVLPASLVASNCSIVSLSALMALDVRSCLYWHVRSALCVLHVPLSCSMPDPLSLGLYCALLLWLDLSECSTSGMDLLCGQISNFMMTVLLRACVPFQGSVIRDTAYIVPAWPEVPIF